VSAVLRNPAKHGTSAISRDRKVLAEQSGYSGMKDLPGVSRTKHWKALSATEYSSPITLACDQIERRESPKLRAKESNTESVDPQVRFDCSRRFLSPGINSAGRRPSRGEARFTGSVAHVPVDWSRSRKTAPVYGNDGHALTQVIHTAMASTLAATAGVCCDKWSCHQGRPGVSYAD
jgi:hypothetical protein